MDFIIRDHISNYQNQGIIGSRLNKKWPEPRENDEIWNFQKFDFSTKSFKFQAKPPFQINFSLALARKIKENTFHLHGAKHSSPSLHLVIPSGKIDPNNIMWGNSMILQKSTRQWLIIVMLWISALRFVYQCNFFNLEKLFDYMKKCWNKIEEIF